MKNSKLLLSGLTTMSLLMSACGSKSESGSRAPTAPVPPQTSNPPAKPVDPDAKPRTGGDIPNDGPTIPAPRNNNDVNPGDVPGVPYKPTPLPGNHRRDDRRDTRNDGPMTPEERRDQELERQRRERGTRDDRRTNNDRRDTNNDRRDDGGIDQGPTPIQPPGPRGPAKPANVTTQPEQKTGLAWYPPQIFETPAAAWLHYKIDPMLKSVGKAGPQPKSLANRVKVTLALGYFDGYEKGLKYEGENYGKHVAVDPFLRAAVDKVLTRDCGRDLLQVCGFELKSINDVEAIYFRGGFDDRIQEIRVISGALHPRLDVTTGSRAEEQKRRSARTEEAFSKAFLDSDLVVYVGHSRLGGGPDFNPPRLKNDKVDYPSYQKERAGARRTLRAVKDLNRRAQVLALLSCDSTDHFLGEIRKSAPDLQLATMKGNITSEDQMTGGLLAIDLFLRQGHLNGLKTFVSGSEVLGSAMTVLNGNKAAR